KMITINQEELPDRCPTGIPGFDEITNGGFIRGSLILLAGNPGTGKTSFSAKFLYEGITRYNEPGVYVCFAESKEKFFRYMNKLGMNFKSLDELGMFKFLQMPTVVDSKMMGEIVTEILGAVDLIKAKRLVIDSITPIIQLESPIGVRSMLHNALMNFSHTKNLTTILIADLPFGEKKVGYGVEEFIVDSVILLRLDYRSGRPTKRYIEVVKMRGVNLSTVIYEYSILPNKGFKVYPPLNPGEVKIDPKRRLSTGIEGLDNILGGGIVRGLSNLIVGPPGSGKTMICLSIAAEVTLRGESVLFISIDRPVSQLEFALSSMGYDVVALKEKGLRIMTVPSQKVSPYNIIEDLYRMQKLEGYVILDDVCSIRRSLGEDVFMHIVEELVNFFKVNGITSIFCLTENPTRWKDIPLSVIMDNILILDVNIANEGPLKRSLRVLKAGMNNVDFRGHELYLLTGRPVIK
ncbi:MAG: hypothetical protein DRN06_08735, partial [Thermoprotei archaeon]